MSDISGSRHSGVNNTNTVPPFMELAFLWWRTVTFWRKIKWGDGRWCCSHFKRSQGSLFWRGSLEPRLERVMGSLHAEHSRQRIFYRFVPVSHPLSGSSWKLSSPYVSLSSLCVPQIHKTYHFEVLTMELQRQLPGDRHQNCFREPDTMAMWLHSGQWERWERWQNLGETPGKGFLTHQIPEKSG